MITYVRRTGSTSGIDLFVLGRVVFSFNELDESIKKSIDDDNE